MAYSTLEDYTSTLHTAHSNVKITPFHRHVAQYCRETIALECMRHRVETRNRNEYRCEEVTAEQPERANGNGRLADKVSTRRLYQLCAEI